MAALVRMDRNDPNFTEASEAWHKADKAYGEVLAALTGNQQATVSQTFKVPDALVDAKNVQYVGVHDTNPFAAQLAEAERKMKGSPGDETLLRLYENTKTLYDGWEEENNSGAEFGEVHIPVYIVDADGKLVKNDEFINGITVMVGHSVNDFSPFIVYAFVEQPEQSDTDIAANTEGNPPALPAEDKKTLVYTVARGDTLWAISKKYGCTVAEIVALNGELIKDPDLILVGWELTLPLPQTA